MMYLQVCITRKPPKSIFFIVTNKKQQVLCTYKHVGGIDENLIYTFTPAAATAVAAPLSDRDATEVMVCPAAFMSFVPMLLSKSGG